MCRINTLQQIEMRYSCLLIIWCKTQYTNSHELCQIKKYTRQISSNWRRDPGRVNEPEPVYSNVENSDIFERAQRRKSDLQYIHKNHINEL